MQIERKISTRNEMGRNGYKPEIFVLHLADGFYPCLAASTSYHYAIGKNGEVAESVPINRAAWTQGVAKKPTAKLIIEKLDNDSDFNPNWNCIGIECAGFYNDFYSQGKLKEKGCQGQLTDKQVESIIDVIKYANELIYKEYGYRIPYDRDHIIGHYEINPVTRSYCGKNFPYKFIIDKLSGNDTAEKEEQKETENKNNLKFKVGDKALLNGKLFSSSTNDVTGKVMNIQKPVNISRVYPDAKHPYYISPIGYADENMLSPFCVYKGCIVKIIGDKYDTGTTIKDWVKEGTYTVDKVDEQNGRARLKEIFSWVPIDGLLIL